MASTTSPAAPVEGEGHYNRITKQWETPDQYVVNTKQDGQTFPEEIGEPGPPSFKEQVMGNAKKFAGKVFGKDHEVAQGEALLQGKGVDGAIAAGEAAKN